jgi:hypothetical protein
MPTGGTVMPRLVKDRTMQEAAMRAGLRLVHFDIEIGVEFYEETRSHYSRKAKTLEEKHNARPSSYWSEDVGDGTTRGDLASEEYGELEEMLQLNSYFGMVTVFGALERCFLRIFQDMKSLKLVEDKHQKKRSYLTLGGYKDALKSVDIHVAKQPFKWSDIIKFQDLRDAIAHQNGFVTEENINRLTQYGYKKLGQRVEISDKYFRSAVELAKESSTLLVKEYSKVIRKLGRKKIR